MQSARLERYRSVVAVVFGVLLGGLGVHAAVRWLNPDHEQQPQPPSTTTMDENSTTSTTSVVSRTSAFPLDESEPQTLEAQREMLFATMVRELEIDPAAMDRVREIFSRSKWLGQGNPDAVQHPMSRKECRVIRAKEELTKSFNPTCSAFNMVPLYNVEKGETEKDAHVCIDQFEFPNIACEYPVVWVQANEAADLCKAIGKRICDAHEWEGSCAGSLRPIEEEYDWRYDRQHVRHVHNAKRFITWAYGKEKNHSLCATASKKNDECNGGNWEKCGSNTYPAGSFPQCVSSLGVYDLHGNAAEHMNYPRSPEELASRGGSGETEMKGSWFIFQKYEAHPDDCRWRAPDWHVSKLAAHNSHMNYHLGFRCCGEL